MRKGLFVFCLLLFGISSVFLNCSDEETAVEPKPKPGPTVICPLAVGNVWTYVDTIWLNSGSPAPFTSNIQITGDTLISIGHADYHAFFWVEIDSFVNEPTTLIVANENDGLWELGIRCANDSSYIMNQAVMYPVEVGDKWSKRWTLCVMDDIMGFPPDTTRCISVDSLITTPAGNFRCHVFHEHYTFMGENNIHKYWAPNVGLVGWDWISSQAVWKKRLSSYTLR